MRYLRLLILPFVALPLLFCASISPAGVVLQYHHISSKTPAATSTSPELFRRHMQLLDEGGFEVVPLPELLAEPGPVADKRVAITFDDGYASVYTEAFPELKRRQWPFTVFVNTRPLDEGWNEFSSWEQIREMAAAGATIANHTVNHDHMIRRQPEETEAQWRERMRGEILQAEERIEEETGQSHQLLAYPFGEYDAALLELVESLGFTAFGQHSGPLGGWHSQQALARFPFGGPYGTDESDFLIKAGSRPLALKALALEGASVPAGEDMDPRLAAGEARPRLSFQPERSDLSIQCFASGQGAVPLRQRDEWLDVTLKADLPAGRSRINCTAAAGEGRFFWFSQPFVRPYDNGRWPPE